MVTGTVLYSRYPEDRKVIVMTQFHVRTYEVNATGAFILYYLCTDF